MQIPILFWFFFYIYLRVIYLSHSETFDRMAFLIITHHKLMLISYVNLQWCMVTVDRVLLQWYTVTWLCITAMTQGRPWCIHHSIMMNVTWRHFDQSAKQLIVGHMTKGNLNQQEAKVHSKTEHSQKAYRDVISKMNIIIKCHVWRIKKRIIFQDAI